MREMVSPVQRRILCGCDIGIDYEFQYKKSASVVGEVIGKYHPGDGDSSIYDTMVRKGPPFSLRYP